MFYLTKTVDKRDCDARPQYESHNVTMFHGLVHFEPRLGLFAVRNVVQHVVTFRRNAVIPGRYKHYNCQRECDPVKHVCNLLHGRYSKEDNVRYNQAKNKPLKVNCASLLYDFVVGVKRCLL